MKVSSNNSKKKNIKQTKEENYFYPKQLPEKQTRLQKHLDKKKKKTQFSLDAIIWMPSFFFFFPYPNVYVETKSICKKEILETLSF